MRLKENNAGNCAEQKKANVRGSHMLQPEIEDDIME